MGCVVGSGTGRKTEGIILATGIGIWSCFWQLFLAAGAVLYP